MAEVPAYTGRFAPTPSGPLHFGSIVAALASYLDARAQGGRWLVRIDDLDPPRVRTGAADDILQTLVTLGLAWDGEVLYQRDRFDAYQAALEILRERGLLYRCTCTRRQTRDQPYPGTCRQAATGTGRHSLRIRTAGTPVRFTDLIQGEIRQDLQRTTGDFIVRRADGLYAYHLAVTVDDAWQGVNRVIRGADLLDATANQVYLQECLALPTPAYGHFPVAAEEPGRKISKRHGALSALLDASPAAVLREAIRFLGQTVDREMERMDVCGEILQRAVAGWDIGKVPGEREIVMDKDSRGP